MKAVALSRLHPYAVAALVLVVAAVSAAGAEIELLHMSNSSHGMGWLAFLQERAEAFNKLHPEVKVTVVQSGSYVDRVTTMIAAGEPPDVTDFAPHHAVLVARNDGFHDLRTFMAQDETFDPESILSVAFGPVTYPTGVIYGLPMDIYPLVTYYNTDIFRSAGLQTPNELAPEDWNWDQVVAIGKKTTRLGPDGTVQIYGIDRPDQRWQNVLVQAGALPYDRMVEPTESRWNQPAVHVAIDWLRSLFLDHQIAAPRGSAKVREHYFWLGTSAMHLAYGPGMIGGAYADLGFGYDVAEPPLGPANRGSTFTVNSFQIPVGSKHPEWAWEWIKFLATNEESAIRFMGLTSRTPVLRSVQGLYPQYAKEPPEHWIKYYEVAQNPDTQVMVTNSLGDLIDPLVNNMLNRVLTGQESVATALAELHRQVSAVFAQHLGPGSDGADR